MNSLYKLSTLLLIVISLLGCQDGLNHKNDDKLKVPQRGINTFYVIQEIDGETVKREVLMEAPSNFDPHKTYPVLFAFHGAGAEGAFWTYYLRQMIDEGEFIAIYPQGFNRVWNLGVENSRTDEIEYLDLLVEKLHGYSNINLDRMYAFGYSNGSGLVLKYAMRTNHFRSAAGLASQLIEGIEPIPNKKPVSTLIVNGTKDNVIPIEGGDSAVGLRFLSAMDSAKKFAELFGCNTEPVERKETFGTMYEFNGGEDGVASWFYQVGNADHGLRQNEDPEFYRKVWTFLKNH
jgi:polyhydroxybutyrate depolymerase